MSVLLIDDDQGIRTLLSRELARRDLKVSTAACGEEGLAHFERTGFPVVVCDDPLCAVAITERTQKKHDRSRTLLFKRDFIAKREGRPSILNSFDLHHPRLRHEFLLNGCSVALSQRSDSLERDGRDLSGKPCAHCSKPTP